MKWIITGIEIKLSHLSGVSFTVFLAKAEHDHWSIVTFHDHLDNLETARLTCKQTTSVHDMLRYRTSSVVSRRGMMGHYHADSNEVPGAVALCGPISSPRTPIAPQRWEPTVAGVIVFLTRQPSPSSNNPESQIRTYRLYHHDVRAGLL